MYSCRLYVPFAKGQALADEFAIKFFESESFDYFEAEYEC
jgi:hypothetical protein